jgi:hypothetical protein
MMGVSISGEELRAESTVLVSLSGFSQPECYTPCFAASSEVLSVNQIPTYGSMSFRSTEPTSLQTFALYGKRFGGIEPHFKDYKSAAWGRP